MTQARPAPAQGEHIIDVAEYVCGLLSPQERARVHVLLSRDDQALAHALAWEEDLLALVDALPRAQPSNILRERLQRTLAIGPPPAFQPPPQPQLLRRPSREPQPPSSSALPSAAATPATVAAPRAQTSDPAETRARPVAASTAKPVAPQAPPEPSTPHGDKAATSEAPKPVARAAEPTAPGHHSGRAVKSPSARQTPLPSSSQAPSAPAAASDATKAGHNRPAERDSDASGPQRQLIRKLWFWRLLAVCAAGAAIVGFILPGEPPPPPVQIVKVAPTRAAILQAPGTTSTPGWTATLGPEGNLMMRPLVYTEVPDGSQVLLWTRSERIPEPRLLGRIDPNQPVQVPAAQLGAMADDQLLEITLETDEDAAKAVANGPILFIGQMTVFGSEGATTSDHAGAAAPASERGASGLVTP